MSSLVDSTTTISYAKIVGRTRANRIVNKRHSDVTEVMHRTKGTWPWHIGHLLTDFFSLFYFFSSFGTNCCQRLFHFGYACHGGTLRDNKPMTLQEGRTGWSCQLPIKKCQGIELRAHRILYIMA